jgi:hypothetical protein
MARLSGRFQSFQRAGLDFGDPLQRFGLDRRLDLRRRRLLQHYRAAGLSTGEYAVKVFQRLLPSLPNATLLSPSLG